jgi:mRNA interferase MazF
MQRGEIRIVSFDRGRGSEVQKHRPAVIVSNDGANSAAVRLGRGVITVVPLTSNVARVYPFQVLLIAAETGLERDSKAQAEQLRAIAVERVARRIGVVPPVRMAELDEALRLHLAL